MIGRKNTGEQKPSNGRRSAFVLALPKNCHDDAGLVEGSDDDAAFAGYHRFVIQDVSCNVACSCIFDDNASQPGYAGARATKDGQIDRERQGGGSRTRVRVYIHEDLHANIVEQL